MHVSRARLHGLHHVTAATADADRCVGFYERVLGLDRLDRALGYETTPDHCLSFGDRLGRPGSIINFVERSGLGPGRAGAGMIHRIAWRVPDVGALAFWERRLAGAGAPVEAVTSTGPDALPSLRFADPEGLAHELVVDTSGDEPLCAGSGAVPAERALRGLDGVHAYCRARLPSADLLAGRLDFAVEGPDRYRVGGPGRRGHYVYDDAPARRAVFGAGTVDHVAFACDTGDERVWRQRVIGMGARVTTPTDGEYFRSIRFREPSGVLLEIASRGPASAIEPGPVPADAVEPPTEELAISAPA